MVASHVGETDEYMAISVKTAILAISTYVQKCTKKQNWQNNKISPTI